MRSTITALNRAHFQLQKPYIFLIVIPIGYAVPSVISKSLHVMPIKTCTTKDNLLFILMAVATTEIHCQSPNCAHIHCFVSISVSQYQLVELVIYVLTCQMSMFQTDVNLLSITSQKRKITGY